MQDNINTSFETVEKIKVLGVIFENRRRAVDTMKTGQAEFKNTHANTHYTTMGQERPWYNGNSDFFVCW